MASRISNKDIQERMLQDRLEKVEAPEHEFEERLKKHEADKEAEQQEMARAIEQKMQDKFEKMFQPYKHLLLQSSEVTRTLYLL